jgi:plasmid replication initiation protein
METRATALPADKLFDFLDSPLHGKVRGEQSIMDFPLFSLAKRPQMEAMTYGLEGVQIEIKPSASGIATMWDKEILIYVLSLMVQHMHRTSEVQNVFTFNAHDFFRATGVARPSKRDYDRFIEALGRLQGTQIRTNIKTGTIGTKGFFSWFAEAQATTRETSSGADQLMPVRVQICDWLVRAVSRDSRIYDYHNDYFRLGSIERRLYELAHCYCRDESYEMPLNVLGAKIGSASPLRTLKLQLKKIAAENKIPGYSIGLHEVLPTIPPRDKLGRKVGKPETFVTLCPKDRPSTNQSRFVA